MCGKRGEGKDRGWGHGRQFKGCCWQCGVAFNVVKEGEEEVIDFIGIGKVHMGRVMKLDQKDDDYHQVPHKTFLDYLYHLKVEDIAERAKT
jgi:hypothetical protein